MDCGAQTARQAGQQAELLHHHARFEGTLDKYSIATSNELF